MYNIKNNIVNMELSLKDLASNLEAIKNQVKDNAMKNVRALSSPDIEFYALTHPIGCLPSGTVFYYDENDCINGSPSQGCLKLAWSQDGNCQGGLCGDAVVFHAIFRYDTTVFRRLYAKGDF